MSAPNEKAYCQRCEHEINHPFCGHCGQARAVKRINGQYLLSEIGSVLNFHKGLLYTIKELLLRPGLTIRNFILGDRSRLVRPIIFLIICSLVYTVAQQYLHFEDGYANYHEAGDSVSNKIGIWVQQNYGYANILMAVFIGFWIKILFRKYAYNFFEILILLSFVMGIGMLFYTVFGILEYLTTLRILHLGSLIGFGYAAWAIGRFYDKEKKINYLKGFISYILGMISFSVVAKGLGSLIDFFLK